MTARQMLEALLVELNKVNAPSLLLEDYNYFINKAINQYVNKQYNFNDINQQCTDNVRVLKSTAILTPKKVEAYTNKKVSRLLGATYEVELPSDYLHMLNCICIYKVDAAYKCYNQDSYWEQAAKRLTADSWSTIINDYYNRPTYKRPYYYIHNVNKSEEEPYNLYDSTNNTGTDQYTTTSDRYVVNPLHLYFKLGESNTAIPLGDTSLMYNTLKNKLDAMNVTYNESELRSVYPIKYTDGNRHLYFSVNRTHYYMWLNVDDMNDLKLYTSGENPQSSSTNNRYIDLQIIKMQESTTEFPREISLTLPNTYNITSLVDKDAYIRHSNPSSVRCEIRYGKDDSVFKLEEVVVDYIKSPQCVKLTQEQMDLTIDTSQIMEFPDYVCQEIINELVHIVMENGSDQRLQTHIPVSQSIASPAQQQAAK